MGWRVLAGGGSMVGAMEVEEQGAAQLWSAAPKECSAAAAQKFAAGAAQLAGACAVQHSSLPWGGRGGDWREGERPIMERRRVGSCLGELWKEIR